MWMIGKSSSWTDVELFAESKSQPRVLRIVGIDFWNKESSVLYVPLISGIIRLLNV